MDTATLSAIWPIENPATPEPLGGGINNKTFRVRSDSGDYILRLYPPSTPAGKIAFETELLAALSHHAFPFQVPVPMPSRTGAPAPLVASDSGHTHAMLTPVIPGSVCQPANADQAFAAGEALGMLAKAMGSMTLATPSGPSYGDLERINPMLPDPLAAADLPFVDADARQRLTRLLTEMLTQRDAWYRILPRQIIHGDNVPFNLLMVGDRVSAVLDFELACIDVRALDFVIGFWPWLWWNQTTTWPLAEAFGRAYTVHQPLTPVEAEAIPFLLRLRRAITLVWWAGRYRQGIVDAPAVAWTVTSALNLEDWLSAHGGELAAYSNRLTKEDHSCS